MSPHHIYTANTMTGFTKGLSKSSLLFCVKFPGLPRKEQIFSDGQTELMNRLSSIAYRHFRCIAGGF